MMHVSSYGDSIQSRSPKTSETMAEATLMDHPVNPYLDRTGTVISAQHLLESVLYGECLTCHQDPNQSPSL